MQRRIKIHGKSYWVTVHRYFASVRSDPVWYAIADYEGVEIFVGGPSEQSALKSWVEAAKAGQPK